MSLPDGGKRDLVKLPVWRTIGDAYAVVFRNLGTFASLAAIPFALSEPLEFVNFAISPLTPEDYLDRSPIENWSYPLSVLLQLIWAVFAVSWHRFVLLGSRDALGLVQFRLGRREMRFFLYSLIFVLPIFVVNFVKRLTFNRANYGLLEELSLPPFATLMTLSVISIVVVVIWICCALIFPAVAVGSDQGLGMAWRQLRGSTWRLVWIFVMASVPLGAIGYGFGDAMIPMMQDVRSGEEANWTATIILSLVSSLIGFLLAAVAISALSLAYRHLTGWTPADARLRKS